MPERSTPAAAPQRRTILLVAGLLAIALAAVLAVFALKKPEPPPALVGGPFTLVDQDGRTVDESLLKGKWSAVFFGYTYCPDVCPGTLQVLAQGLDRLGPKAKDVQVVFVSVDPARDTPAQLKTYLSSPVFPKGAIGLTGTPQQVAEVAKAYRVYYAKSGDGPDYAMDHSSIVYLMDPKGRFDRVLAFGLTPEEIAKQIGDAMRG